MSKLILISVPIGNLEDITERARNALRDGEIFFVEDTRSFKALLGHYGINLEKRRIDSFHDQSDQKKMEQVLELLEQGEPVYLVSEAGSPLISDPAYPLIQKVLSAGYELETLPGVSSVVAALELSGLPAQPFHFHAFLARSGKDRFQAIEQSPGTHIFFEAPARVEATITELCAQFSQAKLVIARELTKKFETIYRFGPQDWQDIRKKVVYKGEFVILIHIDEACSRQTEAQKMAQEYLDGKRAPKLLAKLLAELTGKSAKEVYNRLNQ